MGDLESGNKSVVRQFSDALNARNLHLLDNLVAPDFVRHCQATPGVRVRSLEDFKRFIQDDWASIPDSRMTPRLVVAEGDLVAFYGTYAGTQTGQMGPFPPTNKHCEFDFSGVFRLGGGRIAEMWVTWDNLAVLTQLGLMPPPLNPSA